MFCARAPRTCSEIFDTLTSLFSPPPAAQWRCRADRATIPRMTLTGTRVVVVGQGYVGLPLAMRAVTAGYDVVGYDLDPERVKRLQAGESLVEDVASDVLTAALDSERYQVSSEPSACAGFDVAVVAAPTPLRDGLPDLSYLEDAARTLAGHLRPGATVIIESTSYPGTTQEKVLPILEEGSGLAAGSGFHLGYSPERIDPGNTTWTLVTTPKVVSGIDEDSLRAVEAFYSTIVNKTVAVSSPREAELTKLVENTFRHVNIALVNELAMFARDLGIDVWEAIEAASSKPFGYMPFRPGPGVGGHCLPIDPVLPLLAGGTGARQELPLRRARGRHQQSHAGLRCQPAHDVAQRARAAGQGRAHPAARAGLQEEHRRRAGIPGGAGGGAAAVLGADVRAADPHVASDRSTGSRGSSRRRTSAEPRSVVVLLRSRCVRSRSRRPARGLRAGHAEPAPRRAQRRAPVGHAASRAPGSAGVSLRRLRWPRDRRSECG